MFYFIDLHKATKIQKNKFFVLVWHTFFSTITHMVQLQYILLFQRVLFCSTPKNRTLSVFARKRAKWKEAINHGAP